MITRLEPIGLVTACCIVTASTLPIPTRPIRIQRSNKTNQRQSIWPKRALLTPASPFYLSVDSPIDQAPSVDTVAAARLRGLKVTHVTHLMQRDPNRLSDALGMASVDAATIRRWQAECRLACRVPNLRGFDARVLVGCGVTTPGQLAAIHPTDLLHEVEAFLATDAGKQMLLSGTSQELSRIMTWIATANSAADRGRIGSRDSLERVHRRRVVRTTTGLDSEDEIKVSRPEKQTVKPKVHRRVRRRAISDRDAAPSVVVTYDSTNGESVNSGKSIQRELRFYLHATEPGGGCSFDWSADGRKIGGRRCCHGG